MRALERLAATAGLNWSARDELPAEADLDGVVPLGELDLLVHVGARQGLPLEILELSGAEVEDWLRRDRPLLAWSDSAGAEGAAAGSWWVLSRADDQRVRLVEYGAATPVESLVPYGEIPERFGLGPARRTRWAAVPQGVGRGLGAGATPKLHPLRRLVGLVRPDRRDLLAVAAFAVAVGVLLLATPIAVQALVNFVAMGGALPPLLVVVLLLFLGLAFAGVLTALQTWVVELLQRRLFVRTVADLAARLPAVSLASVRGSYGPELVNRYFDLETIQKRGSFLLLDGLSVLLSVLVGLVVLAFYHPLLLAFDILLLGVIVLIVLGPIRRGIQSAKAESSAKYQVAAWLEEVARNPAMFKASGVMKSVFERSDALVRNYIERREAHFRIAFGQGVAAIALQVLASTALLGLGGLLVMRGSLTLGQLVAAELILTLVVSSVAKMGKHLEAFYDLMAATDKLGLLLDLPVEPLEGRQLEAADPRGAALELRSVSWAAEGAVPLLERADLEIEPGERVLLQGSSGSGKSALLQLVWGLRTPTTGQVFVDGQDTRELSVDSLRRSVSLVDGFEVLEGSVRENVSLGRAFVSDSDVTEALRRLGLFEELSLLPDGLDTPLAGDGAPLSVGQVARLQVARALVARPRLLLVSDLFGTLSTEEYRAVLDALFDPQAPWTLLFASSAEAIPLAPSRTVCLRGGRLAPVPA